MTTWLVLPLAYLLGSLSSAVLISRLYRLPDPREQGSKNPGATNVLRLGGKKAAVLTLVGDAAKGLVPVLLARALGAEPVIIAGAGMAAFLGHLFPVFFQFKGGKGVATALGVLLGFSWPLGLAAAATWIAMAALFRISSLAALTAAAATPAYTWFLTHSPEFTVASTGLALLLIWRHRANISRLVRGEETRLGR
jgi:acyl phosphate:glycerol-3-phosphate acyltransferase